MIFRESAMRELLDLFLLFARVGVITFGGGYAMTPILQLELVEKRGWTTTEEFLDWCAIAQCTPGVIAVNISTFAGYRRRGVAGGIAATLGMIFPSLVIISVIAMFLNNFSEITYVKYAFAGIRVCVVALILNTVIKMFKASAPDRPAIAIFAVVFVLSAFTSVPLLLIIVFAGVCGAAITSVRRRAK
jgi:chromate transporter